MNEHLFICKHCSFQFLETSNWLEDIKKDSHIECKNCLNIVDVYDIKGIDEDFGFSNLAIVLEDFSAPLSSKPESSFNQIFKKSFRSIYMNI